MLTFMNYEVEMAVKDKQERISLISIAYLNQTSKKDP